MPKLKPGTIIPSKDEDATIKAGIATDPDTVELDAQWFAQAKPASEVFASDTYEALIAMKRPRGRPKSEETKVFTAIRLDAEIVDTFKATGKGWQTRINNALKEWLKTNPAA